MTEALRNDLRMHALGKHQRGMGMAKMGLPQVWLTPDV